MQPTTALKIRFGSSLLLLGALLSAPHRLAAQSQYTVVTQITSGSPEHVSPAINNNGDIVWTQIVNGFSQVYILAKGQSSPSLLPGQQASHNNQFPVIDDARNVVYLKDGVGGGAGLAVVRNSAGVETTIEFSSGNPPGCTVPPAGPLTCTAFRSAGQHFGVAGNGTIISYFDFTFNGAHTRHFDVTGIGTLQCGGTACDFGFDDYPSINNKGDFIFVGSGGIQRSSIYQPNLTITGTSVSPGNFGRINNFGDVVAVSGGQVQVDFAGSYTTVVPVRTGTWADVNGNGFVVFQDSDGSGIQQVFTASICGDPGRDGLIQQYLRDTFPPAIGITDAAAMPNKRFVPHCVDITKSAGSNNYTFAALNSSNTTEPTVALLANSLLNGQGVFCVSTASPRCGLDTLVAAFGSVPALTSGFRPPLDQVRVYLGLGKTPVPAGRHMFGDAVDLPVVPAGNAAQYNALVNAALNAGADYTETDQRAISAKLPCSPVVMACVHADWRKATSLRGGNTPYAP